MPKFVYLFDAQPYDQKAQNYLGAMIIQGRTITLFSTHLDAMPLKQSHF